MTHQTRTSLYATAAISAALAFGSTQALAQDAAAPAIQLPPVAAPAPQPTIVLPPTTVPVAEAPAASPPARAERAAPRPAPRTAQAASAPAAPKAAPSSPIKMVAPVAPPVASEVPQQAPVAIAAAPQPDLAAADAPPPDAVQPDSVRRPVDIPDELIGVVGLGIVALGGFGIAGLLRRRRREQALAEAVYEPEPAFIAETAVTSIPEELTVRPVQYAAMPVAAQQRPTLNDPVLEGPVPTGEARQRLIDDMVAAAPDADNPFTSGKARRKRARIILQMREHEQGAQPAKPFDWRTYRSSTSTDPATPPLVDA